MNRLVRQIALLVMLVFTANVQCWAFNMGDEMAHDLAGQSLSSVVADHDSHPQQDSHSCNQMGHHCCHAISHLLGQVSDELSVPQYLTVGKSFFHLTEDASSLSLEGIYHPPRYFL